MALTNLVYSGSGASLIYGTNNANILSKSIQKKFGSRVEVVNGNGVIDDVIYSGEETSITETKVGTLIDAVGNGNVSDANGIVIRSSIKYSNEDVARVETERLKITLTSGGNTN
jgi:hypothetical protein